MTIKAQDIYFWGLWKRPIRELKGGDIFIKEGMMDLINKESVIHVARVISPDEVALNQKLIGRPFETNEMELTVKIRGRRTNRLVKDEITEFGGTQTLGDLLCGFREKVWWEPTPESDMSQARRK